MSAMALILLWIVLIMLYADTRVEVDADGNIPAKKNLPPPQAGGPTTQPYEVRRGDSLASIARQCNTTREAIISLNAMTPPYRMKLGQLIKVPVFTHSVSRTMDPVINHKGMLELPWSKDEKGNDVRTFQKPEGFSLWFKTFLGLMLAIVIALGVLLFWVKLSVKQQLPPSLSNMNTVIPSAQPTHVIIPEPPVQSTTTATTTSQQEAPDSSVQLPEGPEPVEPVPLMVLNGGGVPGAAQKLSDLMRAEGFVISTVDNADTFTYKKTEVRYRAKDRLWAGVVENWLRLNGYEVVMIEKEKLDTVVEVVIGKK